MSDIETGTIFWFGNRQRGIVVRCLSPEKKSFEVIYHQNKRKWVKTSAFCVDGEWRLSDEPGRVIRGSEYPGLVRALQG